MVWRVIRSCENGEFHSFLLMQLTWEMIDEMCRLKAVLDDLGTETRIPLFYPPVALCTGESYRLTISHHVLPPHPSHTYSSHSALSPWFWSELTSGTDNAAMIAWTAILRLQAGLVTEGYDLPLRPKWSLEDLYDDVG